MAALGISEEGRQLRSIHRGYWNLCQPFESRSSRLVPQVRTSAQDSGTLSPPTCLCAGKALQMIFPLRAARSHGARRPLPGPRILTRGEQQRGWQNQVMLQFLGNEATTIHVDSVKVHSRRIQVSWKRQTWFSPSH